MPKYDAVVVGLGAMGSAALYQLARRGVRVFGIDRYSPPHDHGSSHGDTRITRLAIGENEHYTPLVRRSHAIWREIEAQTGADLLTQCGELIISSHNKLSSVHVEGFFRRTVEAARRHGIDHDLLDAEQIRRRFPVFQVRDEEYGYFEQDAGFVRPEVCIAAQLTLAERFGAQIRRNEPVLAFEPHADRVTIATSVGRYEADTVILAAGAWLPELGGHDFAKLFRVYRQVLAWFAVDGNEADFAPERFPVFIWELADSVQGLYGFPALDGIGLKIATEQYAATALPDAVERYVPGDEIAAFHRNLVAPHFRGVSARCTKVATCLYTVTPDAGFVIDTHPDCERMLVVSCCSGHGFKHSAAIGEMLADMVQGVAPSIDRKVFGLARFT